MKIIWCIIPKIWSFLALLPPPLLNNPGNQNLKNWKKNHMIYGSWDINCNRQNFFVILGHFLPFYTRSSLKIKISKKMKKKSGHIIISHKCTINHDHRLYSSWDMACDQYNCYFPFWAIFCPPPCPPNSPNNENFKKKKKEKYQEISFYTSAPKIMTMCYTIIKI